MVSAWSFFPQESRRRRPCWEDRRHQCRRQWRQLLPWSSISQAAVPERRQNIWRIQIQKCHHAFLFKYYLAYIFWSFPRFILHLWAGLKVKIDLLNSMNYFWSLLSLLALPADVSECGEHWEGHNIHPEEKCLILMITVFTKRSIVDCLPERNTVSSIPRPHNLPWALQSDIWEYWPKTSYLLSLVYLGFLLSWDQWRIWLSRERKSLDWNTFKGRKEVTKSQISVFL